MFTTCYTGSIILYVKRVDIMMLSSLYHFARFAAENCQEVSSKYNVHHCQLTTICNNDDTLSHLQTIKQWLHLK